MLIVSCYDESMKYAIVAYDRNRAIGANNTLPWQGSMKSDMMHVREATAGQAIIMGRKTFESIGRALPNRQNIVVTSQSIPADGITVVRSLAEAFAVVDADRKAIIFGGAQLYEASLGDVDIIYATEIDTIVKDADAFFPELGSEWAEVSREHHNADSDNIYDFDFVVYEKTRQL